MIVSFLVLLIFASELLHTIAVDQDVYKRQLCNGCGLCAGVCPFGCIQEVEK